MGLLSGPSSNIGQKTGHWGSGDCKQPEVVAIFSPCSWQRHRASCLQVIHAYIVSGHKLSLVSQSNSCMLSCDFNGQNGLFSCRLRSSEPSVQSSQRQKCLEVVVLEECYLRCRYMFVSAQWSCRSCAKKRKIGEQQLKNDTTAICSNQGLLLDSWCLLYLITVKDKCTGCSFYCFDMLTSLGTDWIQGEWFLNPPRPPMKAFMKSPFKGCPKYPKILVASHFIRGRGCWSCRLRDGVSLGGAPRSCHLSSAEAPAPGRFGTEPSLPKKVCGCQDLAVVHSTREARECRLKRILF